MVDDQGDKVAHNVELAREMKGRVVAYASEHGLSQAAATRLLLDKALTAAGYPRRKARR